MTYRYTFALSGGAYATVYAKDMNDAAAQIAAKYPYRAILVTCSVWRVKPE